MTTVPESADNNLKKTADMAALRAAKNVLRKEIKRRLAGLGEAEKARQSALVTQMLLETPEYQKSLRVSIFLSMTDEVQTHDILEHILLSPRKCYIPRYIGSSMEMVRLYSIEDYDHLPETAWKIKQPADDETREDALQTGGLDLVLMPGLGFTPQGERLGRGKGYYDTYLSRCAEVMGRVPPTVALAYNEQMCDTIPTSELDVRLDNVLYENKVKK